MRYGDSGVKFARITRKMIRNTQKIAWHPFVKSVLPFVWLIIVTYAAVINPYLDGDEPNYARNSWLIAQNIYPLVDFYSSSMDLCFHIFALWGQLVGHSFEDLRLLPMILVVVSSLLLAKHVEEQFQAPFGMALLAISSLTLYLNTTILVKHYAIANPAFLISFILLFMGLKKLDEMDNPWAIPFLLLSGLFLGIAGNARILFEIFILFYWVVVFAFAQQKKRKALLALSAGFTIPNLFLIYQVTQVGLRDFLFFKYLWRVEFKDAFSDIVISRFWYSVFNTFLNYQIIFFWALLLYSLTILAKKSRTKERWNWSDKSLVTAIAVIAAVLLIYIQSGWYWLVYSTNCLMFLIYPLFYVFSQVTQRGKQRIYQMIVLVIVSNFLVSPFSEKLYRWIPFEFYGYNNPIVPAIAGKMLKTDHFQNAHLPKLTLAEAGSFIEMGRNTLNRYFFGTVYGESVKYFSNIDRVTTQASQYFRSHSIGVKESVILDPLGATSHLLGSKGLVRLNPSSYEVSTVWDKISVRVQEKARDYHLISREEIERMIIRHEFDMIIDTYYLRERDKKLIEKYYQLYFTDRVSGTRIYVPPPTLNRL